MYLETTPDTSGYMIAGFVIAFATMGIYILSMYLRNKNLNQDLETLESVQVERKPKAGRPKTTKTRSVKKTKKT